MEIEFKVTITIERLEGKFASRDELKEILRDEIEQMNPSSITTENDAEYEIIEWEVEPVYRKKKN